MFVRHRAPIHEFTPSAIGAAVHRHLLKAGIQAEGRHHGLHSEIFAGPGPAKLLVGEPPQTRLFGTKCPKEVGCVTAAVAPVPYKKTADKAPAVFNALAYFTN